MTKRTFNEHFYKAIDFWGGLFLLITNLYSLIQGPTYGIVVYFFDFVILVVSILLIADALFRKQQVAKK